MLTSQVVSVTSLGLRLFNVTSSVDSYFTQYDKERFLTRLRLLSWQSWLSSYLLTRLICFASNGLQVAR
jgi:hypothetical protein